MKRRSIVRVRLAGGMALMLSGCAIHTPYTNISQWPVARDASYYHEPAPYRIGVLPLTDQRPAEERTGKQPHGVFLILWNRRIGDYYTGDRLFGGNVAQQLSDRLTEYLHSSNVFAQTIPIATTPQGFDPSDSAAVSRLGLEQVVDYLLGGELQHFFGSQSQHTSIYLLPLYVASAFGWQDSKTLPWGRTSIAFTLYDGKSGDVVWRHRLEADRILPRERDLMSEAAMGSFVDLAGQLSAELRQLPLDSGSSSTTP